MDRHGIISIAMQISSSGCWLRLNFLPFPLLHIFCHVFSFSAATFSCFFCILVAWDSLSCLVGAQGLELPISAQLVQQEQQLLRQWFLQLFPNPGMRSAGVPSTAASLSALAGLHLQRLASSPSVPLEELHDLMVLISGQLSAHQSSNPLQLLHLGLFCRVLRLSFSFVG